MVNLNSVISTTCDAQVVITSKGLSASLFPLADVRGRLSPSPEMAALATSLGRHVRRPALLTANDSRRGSLFLEWRRAMCAGARFVPTGRPPSGSEIAPGGAVFRVKAFCVSPRDIKKRSAVKTRTMFAVWLSTSYANGPLVPRDLSKFSHAPIVPLKDTYYGQAVRNLAAANTHQETGLFAELETS